MIKNRITLNNKERIIAVTAAAIASLLVASIATIGAAPFSYQQGASERQGPRITSANIVDGEVRNQDLAPDAVTTDKIRDGEVKAEDLDPSVRGGAGGLEFQVTERSSSTQNSETSSGFFSVNVQCNSDEIVTGGGFARHSQDGSEQISILQIYDSKKQDNGWSATWYADGGGTIYDLIVYAECLKVVNDEGTTTG